MRCSVYATPQVVKHNCSPSCVGPPVDVHHLLLVLVLALGALLGRDGLAGETAVRVGDSEGEELIEWMRENQGDWRVSA